MQELVDSSVWGVGVFVASSDQFIGISSLANVSDQTAVLLQSMCRLWQPTPPQLTQHVRNR